MTLKQEAQSGEEARKAFHKHAIEKKLLIIDKRNMAASVQDYDKRRDDFVAGYQAAWSAAQPQWLPIDTAPRDGTVVFVYFKGKGWLTVSWDSQEDEGSRSEYAHWHVDDDKHGPYPLRGYSAGDDVAWMPRDALPTPPTQPISGEIEAVHDLIRNYQEPKPDIRHSFHIPERGKVSELPDYAKPFSEVFNALATCGVSVGFPPDAQGAVRFYANRCNVQVAFPVAACRKEGEE